VISESFWDFSVRTYRRTGVPEACLSLQNDYGVDVNMVLYCVWIGAASGVFDDESFSRSSEFSKLWADNIVIPIRSARTWMKTAGCHLDPVPTAPCMEFREEIKSVEFAAEKMQQEVLESMSIINRDRDDAPAEIVEHAVANLAIYFQNLEVSMGSKVRDKLAVILSAAFPGIEEQSVHKALAD
jgi:uncharacterized protein (TIGR02444 family)